MSDHSKGTRIGPKDIETVFFSYVQAASEFGDPSAGAWDKIAEVQPPWVDNAKRVNALWRLDLTRAGCRLTLQNTGPAGWLVRDNDYPRFWLGDTNHALTALSALRWATDRCAFVNTSRDVVPTS